MALYTISDLHLPLGIDKPMDIFGGRWENYVEKLREGWQQSVTEEDTVVLPGDFSWATYLHQAERDFEFLHSLNGKKILLKGNHDYWWTTQTKMKQYMAEKQLDDISILQNNSYTVGRTAVCGTRGWGCVSTVAAAGEDKKILNREIQRFELSLRAARDFDEIIAFFHYPPIAADCTENEFTHLMRDYGVKKCVYGHIHGRGSENALRGFIGGVEYLLVSCDYLLFSPLKLCD